MRTATVYRIFVLILVLLPVPLTEVMERHMLAFRLVVVGTRVVSVCVSYHAGKV